MFKKNDIVTLKIDSLSSDGLGVARCDGMVVFVHTSAPGDTVTAKIVKIMKTHAFAIIETFIEKSDQRVENDCAHFPQCGGCKFRHLSYDSELEAKQSFLTENIKRIASLNPNFKAITASPAENRYRNKAQFPVAMIDEKAEIGIFASRSHRLIPIDDCKIQPEVYIKIIGIVKNFLNTHKIPAYNELTHSGLVRHLCIRSNHDLSEVMVIFVINGSYLPNSDVLIQLITEDIPSVKSIMLSQNTKKTNVIVGTKETIIYGEPTIKTVLMDTKFEISANSFFQVNYEATELLYNQIKEYAQPNSDEIILDLYCGIGSIGLCIAKNAKQLIGVEIIESAISDAKSNALINGVENARFISADVSKASNQLVAEGLKPDTVIIDPPRKGIDIVTLNAICKMNPKKIVYVSCNSATLARDLKLFAEDGYATSEVAIFDMFPRTNHVEAVALLER